MNPRSCPCVSLTKTYTNMLRPRRRSLTNQNAKRFALCSPRFSNPQFSCNFPIYTPPFHIPPPCHQHPLIKTHSRFPSILFAFRLSNKEQTYFAFLQVPISLSLFLPLSQIKWLKIFQFQYTSYWLYSLLPIWCPQEEAISPSHGLVLSRLSF